VGKHNGRHKSDSTTPITLVSLTGLDREYSLYVNGNFIYRLGVRYWIKGNRKTTATATVTSNLENEITGYYNNLGAGDDDGEIFLTIRTGDFRPDVNISMAVGASGDVIIVTGVYVQVVISRNAFPSAVKINERGLAVAFARHATIDGYASHVCWAGETRAGARHLWCTGNGTDVLATMPPFPVRPGVWLHLGHNEDYTARLTPLMISIVVIAQ
jgi:hypothetical protein